MPRPKKPDDKDPKPEHITVDDFIRLTQEAENAFHERQRRERNEQLARSHKSKVCWACVALIALTSLVQGLPNLGFHLEETSFRCLIAALMLPVSLSLADTLVVALKHQLPGT